MEVIFRFSTFLCLISLFDQYLGYHICNVSTHANQVVHLNLNGEMGKAQLALYKHSLPWLCFINEGY